MTFTGKVSGLKASSLHAQYFEEYVALAGYLDRIIVVTDTVEYLPSGLPSNLEVREVGVVRFPKVYGLTKMVGYCLQPLLRRVDVIYVRTFSPPELASLWVGSSLRDYPSVLTIGGTWLFGKPYERPGVKKSLFRWILRRAAYAASMVTLYSRYMMPEVRYFIPRIDLGRLRFIHNSVNVKRFRPGLRSPAEWESDGRRRIFWVGRINEGKGVEDLVEAFARVAGVFRDVDLWIAGTGDWRYINYLRGRCRGLGVAGRVVFPGPIPNEEVPRYMANAAVFAYPSRGGEGIPRALLEAMACGAAVVASRVSGIPEAVIDGETGMLVGRQDVEGLARALEMLLADEAMARRLGRNARDKIVNEFSHEVVIPQIASLLKEVSAERSRS
ncbi:Alpha-maltose-1-phosphate synthase [Candidatus Calditenuaceae archaeon HR02]|nr:Alpha-maltose-1-phosphate synthase [Candidatus Calditenuaceae archaeon HR02]